MEAFKGLVDRIIREEDGQGMIEYALIAALISIAAITVIMTFGDDLIAIFTDVKTGLNDGAGA